MWPRAAPTRRSGGRGKLKIVSELERIPGSELQRALESGPFSRALRAAIEARGVSLDRLHRKLGQRGVQIE